MSDPESTINWRRHSDRLTTSGQPTEAQLAAIAALGVRRVVNLGPHHNEGALPDEAGSVAALGMEYIYIPVEFDAPTDADFAAFRRAVDTDAPLHVHCIYNARVSAFFHRAARGTPGAAEAAARMEGIWRPGGVWATFIGRPEEAHLPNRYAGEDY